MRRAGTLGAAIIVLSTWSGAASAQGSTPQPRDGATYEVRLRELERQINELMERKPPAPATYEVRLKDLSQRLEELRERLRRIESRERLITDSMVHGVDGAPTEIDVHDLTTSAFVVTSIQVWVDGEPVYVRTNDRGVLGEDRAAFLYGGVLAAGDHGVRVQVRLAGNGAVLPYMRAYHFEVTEERRFTVDHASMRLDIRIYERGDQITPFEQRPAIAIAAR
jgi:hypothetical protein